MTGVTLATRLVHSMSFEQIFLWHLMACYFEFMETRRSKPMLRPIIIDIFKNFNPSQSNICWFFITSKLIYGPQVHWYVKIHEKNLLQHTRIRGKASFCHRRVPDDPFLLGPRKKLLGHNFLHGGSTILKRGGGLEKIPPDQIHVAQPFCDLLVCLSTCLSVCLFIFASRPDQTKNDWHEIPYTNFPRV